MPPKGGHVLLLGPKQMFARCLCVLTNRLTAESNGAILLGARRLVAVANGA
jgi:hypothetical protein